MSDPKRLRDDGAATTTAKKKLPPPRGLSAISRIGAALSLARIVLINVLALGVTAAVTVHVASRPSRPEQGPAMSATDRASSAATTPGAPAAEAGTPAAAPIEVDLDRSAPAVTTRVPTAPTVNGMAGSNR